MSQIHPTAIVEEGAQLADGVTVGAYSIIGKDVKIGENTFVDSHVVIEGNTSIGSGNKIYSFASVGKESQDLKYAGEETKTIIGDNNKIREFVTIHKGTTDKWETRIGSNNLLMAYVHVAHDVVVGNNCVLANNCTLAGHVEVGDFAIIGGLTPVHQFCRIGSYSMTGGASAINQDICPFMLASGNKAFLHGLNLVGLKRKGFKREDISNLKQAYRDIFRSDLSQSDALKRLRECYSDDKNVNFLVDFIDNSKRGITREQ
ncbi:MAG: acyl-ACP--UDP-N-acetylglucosamine O-acyltransferase [Lentisphaeria bacterium]|nr:acyl-ACP--UDP-N-acetylglucosamine O-acyltransferase [Lentisphaeria bacterium]